MLLQIWYSLLWLWVGLILGYLIFYFRYKDRVIIDNLRKNYKLCKSELEEKNQLFEALKKEKEVLVKQVEKLSSDVYYLSEILKDNDIYIKKAKEAAKKVNELCEILKDFDEDLERKVKEVLERLNSNGELNDNKDTSKSSIF